MGKCAGEKNHKQVVDCFAINDKLCSFALLLSLTFRNWNMFVLVKGRRCIIPFMKSMNETPKEDATGRKPGEMITLYWKHPAAKQFSTVGSRIYVAFGYRSLRL